jgi:hypothetical protein
LTLCFKKDIYTKKLNDLGTNGKGVY